MLDRDEQIIVNMLDLGFSPSAIHRLTNLGYQDVKSLIADLCQEYECPAYQLPDAIRRANLAEADDA